MIKIEKKTVYLAGPMFACEDHECVDWRELVKRECSGYYHFLDPMRRDYRDQDLSDPKVAGELVSGDKDDIRVAHILLAHCHKPSAGTSMEIFFAWESEKQVIVVAPGAVSPWIVHHSTIILQTITQAIGWLMYFGRQAELTALQMKGCIIP